MTMRHSFLLTNLRTTTRSWMESGDFKDAYDAQVKSPWMTTKRTLVTRTLYGVFFVRPNYNGNDQHQHLFSTTTSKERATMVIMMSTIGATGPGSRVMIILGQVMMMMGKVTMRMMLSRMKGRVTIVSLWNVFCPRHLQPIWNLQTSLSCSCCDRPK